MAPSSPAAPSKPARPPDGRADRADTALWIRSLHDAIRDRRTLTRTSPSPASRHAWICSSNSRAGSSIASCPNLTVSMRQIRRARPHGSRELVSAEGSPALGAGRMREASSPHAAAASVRSCQKPFAWRARPQTRRRPQSFSTAVPSVAHGGAVCGQMRVRLP
jgi:hypothetical protein